MKLNISFDWAVLTSIFTFLLYWCGYCYYTGYLEFYGLNIDSFDIPIISIIIQGFLNGSKAWLALIIIFLLLSYITSISVKQWQYWSIKTIGLILNLIIILYNLTFYYLVKFIKKYSLVPKVVKFTKDNIPLKLKNAILLIFKYFQKIAFKIKNKSQKIEEFNHRILTRLNLTTPQIKKEVYGNDNEVSINQNFTFDLSFFIHYTILTLLLTGVISLLNIGQQIIDDGKIKAENRFKIALMSLKKEDLSNTPYKLVTVKNQKINEKLFLTDICLKSLCVVTNENKIVQVYDIKDIQIKNYVDKAPSKSD